MPSRSSFAAAAASIRHRGPDDEGIFADARAALGNQRLAILDIEGGHQPVVSDDGRIVVVQNGEIFNYLELASGLKGGPYECRTHSDTEVLLRLYEQHGIDFIQRLNGMFAIAIYDQREQALFLVRDRIGVKPLYVRARADGIDFASEIKSFAHLGDWQPVVDVDGLHHFLTYNYVPPPFTLFRGVKHLMPGHLMKLTPDKTEVQRWWNLAEVQPEPNRSESDWIDEFNSILEDAVRIRMRCDVPFGAFLSGGVDSSSVVGHMSRLRREPVKTFSIGFADPKYDEAPFAAAAAKRFGTEHVCEQVEPDMLDLWPRATWHCDQAHGDVSFLPTWRVAKLAAQHVKVVLTGDGADELFAGYSKYRDYFSGAAAVDLPESKFRSSYFDSISLFSPDHKASLYAPQLALELRDTNSQAIADRYFDEVPHQDRINQALYLDMQLLLSGNNLVKPDRMGMAESLEARTPFLDYRMMEFGFRMPGAMKLRDGETKYLYKKAVAPLIGDQLAYRSKQMFTVPVGDWFRDRLQGYCRQHLRNLCEKAGVFSEPVVMRYIDEHVAGTQNHTREIRALIALSHWHEAFSPEWMHGR